MSRLLWRLRAGLGYWLARRLMQDDAGAETGVKALIESYRPAVDALQAMGESPLSVFDDRATIARREGFLQAGADEALATRVAALRPMTAAVEIADSKSPAKKPPSACVDSHDSATESYAGRPVASSAARSEAVTYSRNVSTASRLCEWLEAYQTPPPTFPVTASSPSQ